MSTPDSPRQLAKLFRITQAVSAVLCGGISAWLFATSRAPVIAWILAVGAVFAIIDVIVSSRLSRD